MSEFTVTEKAMRPASTERRCFYCHEEIGGTHKDDCVLLKKKVRVRMTVEYDTTTFASADQDYVDFHYNESSSCADNALNELKAYSDKVGCLCFDSEFEVVLIDNDHIWLEEE